MQQSEDLQQGRSMKVFMAQEGRAHYSAGGFNDVADQVI